MNDNDRPTDDRIVDALAHLDAKHAGLVKGGSHRSEIQQLKQDVDTAIVAIQHGAEALTRARETVARWAA